MNVYRLIPQPDGSFIDWGRNATINGVRGQGGALWFMGEAAEVLRLVLKYSAGASPQKESVHGR